MNYWYSSCFGLLCAFVLLFHVSPAQVFEGRPERFWLRPDSSTVNDSLPFVFVASHPLPDAGRPAAGSVLQEVADRHYGSLFVVLRPTVPQLSSQLLLCLGAVKVFRDRVEVSGRPLEIPLMDSAACIIKVVYQGPPPRHPGRGRVFISPEVQLAEMLFYDFILDAPQARKVESMLAMKYSINITENSNPDLRNYVSLYDTKAWHASADRLYNEEVLAL